MSEINEIFERDPLELTNDRAALQKVIATMRDMRYKFNLGDTKAGSLKPKAVPKALKGLDSDSMSDLLGEIKL